MTAILGFSELLLTAKLPPDGQRQCLELIQKSGDTLLRLINDILDLSRVEANRLTLDLMDTSLAQILDEVLSVVQGRADEKRLKLEVVRKDPLPDRIRTDPLRLRQILVNLVDNAVKFTEQGEVRITLQAVADEAGNPRLQFIVADTGVGIPADKLHMIFQPFIQADASLTRRFGGTGLGLAIVKRLTQALRGDIAVTSEFGRGSTFTLTLDVQAANMAPPPPRASAAAAPAVVLAEDRRSASRLQGRVLVAEDSPATQVYLHEMLGTRQLEVDVAEDGRQACEMAEQSRAANRPYDLILMDIQMPSMNGHDATRWLRDRGWSGPIFAVTAQVMDGDREKCLAAGCDGHIAKPISVVELERILNLCLRQVPAE
jgi:CheY-like chemotaxis protein